MAEEMGQLGLWSYNVVTRETLWSPGVHRLIGTNPAGDKPSLATVLRNVHPDDRDKLLNAFELSRQGVFPEQRFRVIHQNGYLRWLTSRAEVLYSKDGSPYQIAGLIVDITDQRTALELLRRTQKRLDALAEGVSFSVWSADKNGALTEIPQWRSLGISSPSEVMGWKWLRFIPEAQREEAEKVWQKAVVAKKLHVSRFKLIISPSHEFAVLACAVPITNEDGEVVEWTGLIVSLDEVSHSSLNASEIGAAQIRAARALLDWSVEDLANRSGISISSIRRMERGETTSIRERTLVAIEAAFTMSGVIFEKRSDIISVARQYQLKNR
jgi:PAS domain-containing protein/DNA-binding Xre family transcriptional regulator